MSLAYWLIPLISTNSLYWFAHYLHCAKRGSERQNCSVLNLFPSPFFKNLSDIIRTGGGGGLGSGLFCLKISKGIHVLFVLSTLNYRLCPSIFLLPGDNFMAVLSRGSKWLCFLYLLIAAVRMLVENN